MDAEPGHLTPQRDTYWLTRFVLMRWMGAIYLVAFYVAARQLVPLVGEHGLTPAEPYFESYSDAFTGFLNQPSLFWFDHSDTMLRVIPWLGVVLSAFVLAGYANAIIMTVLWFFYVSIVFVGLSWYGYGWEIQMSETGFLCIFLCPLLDARPFPRRPPPFPVILLFRWLIVRIMLGSALIKLRGDSCWHDLTALYYHFETQPIPNPFSRYFHFLPHPVLQFGVLCTFACELIAPFFAFWPRWGRYIAGGMMISFQFVLIVSGNLSFFNWLTILPALACFDDRVWRRIVPTFLTSHAVEAQLVAKPSRAMAGVAWAVTGLVGVLSIEPVINLFGWHFDRSGNLVEGQAMNTSYDPLYLVNSYGAFGTVSRDRPVVIFEGTNSADPDTATDWKEYPYAAGPWDPKRAPGFIAPYQPHLDWQLWFVALTAEEVSVNQGAPSLALEEYPWMWNLVWKMLHNDPATMGLFGGDPFPGHPPRYIRAVLYVYHFAKPGNPEHTYWTRERLGLLMPAYSVDSPELREEMRMHGISP